MRRSVTDYVTFGFVLVGVVCLVLQYSDDRFRDGAGLLSLLFLLLAGVFGLVGLSRRRSQLQQRGFPVVGSGSDRDA